MKPTNNQHLPDALQDLKEAAVHKLATRLISDRITFGEVVGLLRARSCVDTVRYLRRQYLLGYLWRKVGRIVAR